MKIHRAITGIVVLTMMVLVATGGLVVAQDKYIVAADIPWAPFEMVTNKGEFFGFDLDAIRMIAIVAGFEVEILNTGFDVIIQNVITGKADLGVSGFTITAERAKTIDYSNPYYLSNQAVVIRKDSGLNIITAMAGLGPRKAIGAQNGSTGFYFLEDELQGAGLDIEVKGYEFYPTAILDLVTGRLDAVLQDEPASQSSISAYPDLLMIAGIVNTYEYFGFLVAPGDPQGLLPRINDAVSELGLKVVEAPGGAQMLVVTPGSPWDDLLKAYFGPTNDELEAAWLACKDLLLVDKDVDAFAKAMADEVAN
ncbi:MAG: transporter substrate-binding domain-containing protein [Candidatus Bipolaricaulota bacterium]